MVISGKWECAGSNKGKIRTIPRRQVDSERKMLFWYVAFEFAGDWDASMARINRFSIDEPS